MKRFWKVRGRTFMKKIKENTYLKNTMLNYIFKIFNMLVSYISIPLTLSYLDNERYGIWQTILTIITWASLSNFGIGNGLRNKVTESISEKKYDKLKSYITSAYIYLTIISIIIFVISIILICSIDTSLLFKDTVIQNKEIIISFIIVIFSFCLNFILGISASIVYGIQKSSLVSLSQVLMNIFTLVGIILIGRYSSASLINIALVYMIANSISNIFMVIYTLFDSKLRPNWKYRNKKYGKELTSLGIQFFILQVAGIMLNSTDNFIISSFIGINEVTEYSLVSKLFQVISTLFSILLVQLWSAVAEKVYKNEYIWIKNSMKRLMMLLAPTALILFIMVLKFDFIMNLWVGKEVSVDKGLIYLAGVYAWLLCFNGIFVNIQNGMSRIKIQTIASVICCILNIPLAYVLINIVGLGVLGVMLSNIICLMIITIMCSIDVNIALRKKVL